MPVQGVSILGHLRRYVIDEAALGSVWASVRKGPISIDYTCDEAAVRYTQ